ncbi:MAG: nucleotidyltransferase domain-containing protein [Deltaproteobacteria bacterium]|nr:nucleotidyltransferase domain-containing protein [Deltaproteobacteria bacterium]
MHRQLADFARRSQLSLNQACIELLKKNLYGSDGETQLLQKIYEPAQKLKQHFGEKLCGIILFGSQVTGKATSESDIDLMIILDKSMPIERGLYKWWDDNIVWNEKNMLNPHFVNILEDEKLAGGLWLEIATTGKVIYQKKTVLDKLFAKLKELIGNGEVRMYISNGHPYWVWKS